MTLTSDWVTWVILANVFTLPGCVGWLILLGFLFFFFLSTTIEVIMAWKCGAACTGIVDQINNHKFGEQSVTPSGPFAFHCRKTAERSVWVNRCLTQTQRICSVSVWFWTKLLFDIFNFNDSTAIQGEGRLPNHSSTFAQVKVSLYFGSYKPHSLNSNEEVVASRALLPASNGHEADVDCQRKRGLYQKDVSFSKWSVWSAKKHYRLVLTQETWMLMFHYVVYYD